MQRSDYNNLRSLFIEMQQDYCPYSNCHDYYCDGKFFGYKDCIDALDSYWYGACDES